MSSKTVSVDGLAAAVNEGLQEYSKLTSSEVKRAVRKSAKTVKEKIETGAPSRTGRYKSSWVATKQEESSQSFRWSSIPKTDISCRICWKTVMRSVAVGVWQQYRISLPQSRKA